jgi:hypothetical protein
MPMKRRFQISLRTGLLIVAIFAAFFAWRKSLHDDFQRSQHESEVVNLRTRLTYVAEFRSDLKSQLTNPQGKDVQELRRKLAKYDAERLDLLQRIEWQ